MPFHYLGLFSLFNTKEGSSSAQYQEYLMRIYRTMCSKYALYHRENDLFLNIVTFCITFLTFPVSATLAIIITLINTQYERRYVGMTRNIVVPVIPK